MIEKVSTFAQRLNDALAIRETTAAEISRKTGINDGLMSKYKKGYQEAKQENLKLIADALHVNPVWLMGIDVPMETYTKENADFSIDMLDDPIFVGYAKKLFSADDSIKKQVYNYIDFLLREQSPD